MHALLCISGTRLLKEKHTKQTQLYAMLFFENIRCICVFGDAYGFIKIIPSLVAQLSRAKLKTVFIENRSYANGSMKFALQI